MKALQLTASLLITLTLLPQKILAEVNMKDGSLHFRVSELEIFRTYNSRSSHKGLFGFGWCTPVEKVLELSYLARLSLHDCTLTQRVRYSPQHAKDGVLFVNLEDANDKIFFNYKTYQRSLPSGELQIYDKAGRLIEYKPPGGKTPDGGRMILRYNPYGRLRELEIGDSKVEVQIIGRSKLVRSVKVGAKKFEYKYADQDLSEVFENGKPVQSYKYDTYHNLVEVSDQKNKSKIHMSYYQDEDRIREVKNSSCVEKYDFKKITSNYHISKLQKTCGAKKNKMVYEFWYRQNSLGQRALTRARLNLNNVKTETKYNPDSGLEIRVANTHKGGLND